MTSELHISSVDSMMQALGNYALLLSFELIDYFADVLEKDVIKSNNDILAILRLVCMITPPGNFAVIQKAIQAIDLSQQRVAEFVVHALKVKTIPDSFIF